MFDFSFGELALIGAVALVVLGPERLPKVARTMGEWIGKAQRYVAQVKSDINRELDVAEFKRLQEEAASAARAMQSSIESVRGDLNKTAADLTAGFDASASPGAPDPWEGGALLRFDRRYKPGPSIDELAEEVARLKKRLALPASQAAGSYRNKHGRRSRVNRTRIYR